MIHLSSENELTIHLNLNDDIDIKYIKGSYLLIDLKTNHISLNTDGQYCIFCHDLTELINFKDLYISKKCIIKLNTLKNSKKDIYFY